MFFSKDLRLNTLKTNNLFAKGTIYGQEGISAGDLTIEATSHATAGIVKTLLSHALSGSNATVRSLGNSSTAGSAGIFTIYAEGARSTVLNCLNGSGAYPSTPGGGNLVSIGLTFTSGTGASATIKGLYFFPTLGGSATAASLIPVEASPLMGANTGVNDAIYFKAVAGAVGAGKHWQRHVHYNSTNPYSSQTGGVGRFSAFQFDTMTRHASNFGVSDMFILRGTDIGTNQRTAERVHGLQFDLFDANTNGEKWPLYYGDFSQQVPDSAFAATVVAYGTAVTVAVGGWTAAATAVSVNSTTSMTANDICRVENEIITITSVDSATALTVVRAAHGTVGATHASGISVKKLTFTDNTTEAGTVKGTAFTLLDTSDDWFYIGTTSPVKFNRMLINMGVAGSSVTNTWEYWNGSAWATLTVVDNTTNFTQLAETGGAISFTTPTDWATQTVNASTKFWVRVSAGTSPATNPTCTGIMLDVDNGNPTTSMDATGHFVPYGRSRVSTQFDKTSSTALANITGLTVNVDAAKTYKFEAILHTTSNVAGGVQFAIAGTATATAVIYEATVFNAAAFSAQTRATALATAVGGVTAVTVAYARITGTITVNAAGTLTTQFSQNASNGAASSVLVGSTFTVEKLF